MPRCSRCKVEKDASGFGVSRQAPSGLQNNCTVCVRELAWEAQGIFGFSYEQYERLVTEQDGLCAICGLEPPGGGALQVDHNHETGSVRELLCVNCNRDLRHVEERGDWIEKAHAYLVKHRPAQAK